jgi:hypothetical protein
MLVMREFAGGIVNGAAVSGPVFLFYDPDSTGGAELIKVSGNSLSLAINTRLIHTAKLKRLHVRTAAAAPPAVTDDETDGAATGREDNGEETLRVLRLAAFDASCLQLRLLPHGRTEAEALIEHVRRARTGRVPAMPADDRILREDLRRMGVVEGSAWRISTVNAGFAVCPTYPQLWAVPRGISDSVLKHAAAFRVKHRLPILAFVHAASGAAIVRSGQPLVGLWRRRSIQDEHLVDAIRRSTGDASADPALMIVDARPTVNAIANAITGAGFEPLDNYAGCSRHFVHIENVHAIRAAYVQLLGGLPGEWIGHVGRILEATRKIIEGAFTGAHRQSVLVHCSDGWDRTSQLISLAKVCLDPFYRTIRGLLALVYGDWIAAGHRFADRLGHRLPPNSLAIKPLCHAGHGQQQHHHGTMSDFIASHLRIGASPEADDFAPIFPQFLECLGQLVLQHPSAFEYGLAGLRAIALEAMANETGLFGANCEAERSPGSSAGAGKRSQSIEAVWESLCIARPPLEDADGGCDGIIIPRPSLPGSDRFTSILLLQ